MDINLQTYEKILKKFKKNLLVVVGVIILLLLVFNSFTIINAGEVGIKTRLGKIIDTQLNEGLNFKIPFIDRINKMSIKVNKVEVSGNGASKDLQDVDTTIAVNYRVKSESAPNLFRTIGSGYEDVVLKPAISEAVKASLSEYTAEALITQRSEVSAKIIENLQNKVKKYGLEIDNVNIVNFNFSTEFNKAIEEKQVAEQEVLKAKQELEKAKVDAEKQITEAQAEAEALRIQKEELNENILRLREIEVQERAVAKWNGQLPNSVLSDAIPFVNLK